VTVTAEQRRWHEQAISLASLLVACAVTLCSAVVFTVSLAVTMVRDQSRQDQDMVLVQHRIANQERINDEQAERSQRREAENRAAQQQEMAMLTSIQQQLAVHEARGGLGIQFRQPIAK
jgi:hypothetical protein